MSALLIFVGILLMAAGFFMVWRTNLLVQWFGDLGQLFGIINAGWVSWKTAGIIFMVFGFLLATNLFNLFLSATVGRLLLPGV